MLALTVAARSRRNRSSDKPNEDAYAVRLGPDQAVLVVADGVTRSRDAAGRYPSPSGAALAARLVAETVAAATDPLEAAFRQANQAVGAANRVNGVWDRLDYGEHDLWGAVATAVLVRDDLATWAHLGDTLLLQLPAASGMVVCTPNQVTAAACLLDGLPAEEIARVGSRERYARMLLRNRPAVAGSYGVLTGEPAAERYLATGHVTLHAGDRLALLSDGFVSLQAPGEPASGWAALERWLRLDRLDRALDELLAAAEASDERTGARSDDKTAVLLALG